MLKVTVDWKAYLILGIFFVLCLPFTDVMSMRDTWYFIVSFYGLLGVYWGLNLNKSEKADVIRPWIYFSLSLVAQFIGGLI